MDLPINREKPLIMHIDLNSCFATIEQQANPLLRGKPIAVAAYSTDSACILASSIESKRYGIKTGMRVYEGKRLYPNLIIRIPDPPKYRDVHLKFKKIFTTYSPEVFPRSIDEAVIDFKSVQHFYPDLIKVAKEIKRRMKQEIGEWIIASIGIATNRTLAKFAAGMDKPDGLLTIGHTNIQEIFKRAKLIDFPGINIRYEARLNAYGIYTPLDFLNATPQALGKQVFKSIVGWYWYKRLRGYEMDDVEWQTKTIGQQYALQKPTNKDSDLSRLLMKLCEKMGRRLRHANFFAHGIHIGCGFKDHTYWHHGEKVPEELHTTPELYKYSLSFLQRKPKQKIVSLLSVNCFNLTPSSYSQLGLFNENKLKWRKISNTLDRINDIYGEFSVAPATIMDMDKTILDRIAFGRIRELENGFYT